MISKFYKEYKVRDYLDENEVVKSARIIDCSLGTNPYIKNGYIDPKYPRLKSKLIQIIKEDMNVNLEPNNISFGSWHDGNYTKFVRVFN